MTGGNVRTPSALAEALLTSPLGCSFLNEAELHGSTAEEIADPAAAFFLAGRAWGMISPWSPTQARDISGLLRQAPRWTKLAHSILDDPRNAWWFADLDRSAQLRIDDPQAALGWGVPAGWGLERRARHERYTQRPFDAVVTSTAFDGLSSFLVAASDIVEDLGPLTFPVQRSLVMVSPAARIFEVHGPSDWSRLCRMYAADGPG